jgi:hypothetical protein
MSSSSDLKCPKFNWLFSTSEVEPRAGAIMNKITFLIKDITAKQKYMFSCHYEIMCDEIPLV